MKTFLLANGDIVLDSGTFQQITGPTKLVQDLGVGMKEPLGGDRFHLQWGSLLLNYVGDPIDQQTGAMIRSEVQRVINNAAQVQAAKLAQDGAEGLKSRYSTGELIQSIKSVDVSQEQDRYHVKVILTTYNDTDLTVISTVEI